MSAVARKSFQLFGLNTLRKYPELMPLVGIMSFAGTMCGAFCIYATVQKPDVMISRGSHTFPWDHVNPEQPQKFLAREQKYSRIPEKDKLYEEIGVYKF